MVCWELRRDAHLDWRKGVDNLVVVRNFLSPPPHCKFSVCITSASYIRTLQTYKAEVEQMPARLALLPAPKKLSTSLRPNSHRMFILIYQTEKHPNTSPPSSRPPAAAQGL